eukprot:4650914-Prymnesium_polylepis.2
MSAHVVCSKVLTRHAAFSRIGRPTPTRSHTATAPCDPPAPSCSTSSLECTVYGRAPLSPHVFKRTQMRSARVRQTGRAICASGSGLGVSTARQSLQVACPVPDLGRADRSVCELYH